MIEFIYLNLIKNLYLLNTKKMKQKIFFLLLIGLLSCGNKKRIGAVCKDGSRSKAISSGACSHHGGVDYWIYERK